MIEGVSFSDQGEQVTDFEVTLLQQYQAQDNSVLGALARRLLAEFGPRHGTQAMAAVLDELGSEYIYVARRKHFFAGFWRQERDQLIAQMAANGDSCSEIGRVFGMNRTAVHKRMKRLPVKGTGNGPAGKTQA
ncbi:MULTISPECIES: AsnC family protein [Xanthomonas]|uniref:AsnC family protein n=1 Tax=Xanthomonas TaxID=338 RepID=UPI002B238ED6|nr:AsnC family protein [Xanthomonas campestris]MEA9759791.1 AsnC family protein [Xanthomonas campestris pv. raphani]